MPAISVLEARDELIERGLCPERLAEPVAVFAAELLDEAIEPLARKDSLEALIEQWRVERAETAAQQAQFMADIRLEMGEFRKELNQFREEHNQRERDRDERERQRDERERERDERERQRVRDQEGRDAKMRQWVIATVGLGIAAVTLVSGLIAAFG